MAASGVSAGSGETSSQLNDKSSRWLSEGTELYKLRQYTEALDYFEAVIKAQPKNAEAHYLAMKSHEGLKNSSSATYHAWNYVDLEPEDPKANAVRRKYPNMAADKAQFEQQLWTKRSKEAAVDKRLANSPPGHVFQDCPNCPKMVIVKAGEFVMGSPEGESGRQENEGPQHTVRVDLFSVGQTEVTVTQFRQFVQATGYKTDAERRVQVHAFSGCHKDSPEASFHWRSPGWAVKDNEPVVCVSWNDSIAYTDWLNRISGKKYRLPTEAQWEYAARAGTNTSRHWGDDPNQACVYGNVSDQTTDPAGNSRSSRYIYWHQCTDGYWFVAPIAHYKPNAFGLYDMLGNAQEWTLDCYSANEYQRRKDSGQAWSALAVSTESEQCMRVTRGGSSFASPMFVRSASRSLFGASLADNLTGFRLVRYISSIK